MYRALWRKLPNNVALKIFLFALLFLSVTTILFVAVFPAIAPYTPLLTEKLGGIL
jgi:hypothetical protein